MTTEHKLPNKEEFDEKLDYEITTYQSGYTIRQKGKIIDEIARYWTRDGSMHEQTRKELKHYLSDNEINNLTK